MKKCVVILVLLLFACIFGGCAVIPAIVTTGASFAVPQTVSVTVTAVGTVHKTALVAADERHVDDMISDKMLTIQAQAMLLGQPGASMDATCLNGDIYLVGEYAAPGDRDAVIEELSSLKGVNSVKGVVKQMPTSLVALVEPAIEDNHAETVIEAGLLKELHIKSANVDVEVVQGEAVIVGVVADAEEAANVVRIVESLRPKSTDPITVTSLLALQEKHETGLPQFNDLYVLKTRAQMLAAAKVVADPGQKDEVDPVVSKPDMSTLAAYVPRQKTVWQKARLDMKHRILGLAKDEDDNQARRELITLSSRVLKDKYISIEDRLVRTMTRTSNPAVKRHVDAILADIAPHRTTRIQTLAMN